MATKIIGAGLAGLLAGSIFQRAHIFEVGPPTQSQHKAVLRFRSSAVGDTLGIEFNKVTVNKGIFFNNRFVAPDIRLANLYSMKVISRLADRSIWNLAPAERFIAPENLVEQMAERCAGRIEWDCAVDTLSPEDQTISTIPMPLLADMLNVAPPMTPFSYAPIQVRRWHVPKSNVFQTVYFPDPSTNLYRASITGDLLIAEYIKEADEFNFLPAFGLLPSDVIAHDTTKQRYGKIAPIDEQWRKNFIHKASTQHNVFSVGRFAIWKNVLLDDVLKDIHVVKRLMAGDHYSASRHNAQK